MYYLKEYDSIIAQFNIYYDEQGFRVADLSLLSDNSRIPLSLDFSNEGVSLWLKRRSIPKNREFVDGFLAKIGLSLNNTKGIIDICKGLSLNDSYWVVEDSFKKTFSECNLYDNKFSNILAQIAFTGFGTSIKSQFMSSPELTTQGQLAKCWRRINNEIFLYKSGSFGYANSGLEPYSEFYSYQIAKTMGLDAIEYNLSKWKNRLCSTCKLFTDINHSYIPIGYIVSSGGFEAVKNYLISLGESFYNSFIDMIVFDAIIMNTDRHYGNFGLIIDNKTNKPIKFAPIFDNGASLLSYAMDSDFKNLETLKEYANTRSAVMYPNFLQTAKKYMRQDQKDKLKKLINFTFVRHSRYNLDSKRLKMLEKLINERVLYLLK